MSKLVNLLIGPPFKFSPNFQGYELRYVTSSYGHQLEENLQGKHRGSPRGDSCGIHLTFILGNTFSNHWRSGFQRSLINMLIVTTFDSQFGFFFLNVKGQWEEQVCYFIRLIMSTASKVFLKELLF